MDVCNNIAKIFFKEHEVLFGGRIVMAGVGLLENTRDFNLGRLDPPDDFLAFDLLKGKYFIQFSLELFDKVLLVIVRPC